MLQRIQSVFMFLGACSMLAMLFYPIWQKVDSNQIETIIFTATEITHQKVINPTTNEMEVASINVIYIAILAIVIASVIFFSILQYKNRLNQIKLGTLTSFLISCQIGVMMYFLWETEKKILDQERGDFLIGFYLPFFALLCNFLAMRFIRKDEILVRSADRLR